MFIVRQENLTPVADAAEIRRPITITSEKTFFASVVMEMVGIVMKL